MSPGVAHYYFMNHQEEICKNSALRPRA